MKIDGRLFNGLAFSGMGFVGMTIGFASLAIKMASLPKQFPYSSLNGVSPVVIVGTMFVGIAAGTFVAMTFWALMGFAISIILHGPIEIAIAALERLTQRIRGETPKETPAP